MIKINNHLSSYLNSLNTKKTMTYDVGNPCPGMGQAQKCGRIKPVKKIKWISNGNTYKLMIKNLHWFTSTNNKMNCELMLTYYIPALRQTGSRNLTGQKTLPTIWGTYMKLVTKYQISAINIAEKNATKNEHICSMCIKINKVGKQEVGIWWVKKRYPQYGIPIWSLWPNIRFLPSTVTEKNVTKNILDGRKDRGKTVYPSSPFGERGYKNT